MLARLAPAARQRAQAELRPRGALPAPERRTAAERGLVDGATLLELPVLVLPFESLVSDNAKYGVSGGRMILTARYRHAKETVQQLAGTLWRVRGLGRLAPLDGDLTLVARLHEPNAASDADGRTRDPGNLRKLVTDALRGVVYHDDAQLRREVWERAAVDRRAPRLVVHVYPFGREEPTA